MTVEWHNWWKWWPSHAWEEERAHRWCTLTDHVIYYTKWYSVWRFGPFKWRRLFDVQSR